VSRRAASVRDSRLRTRNASIGGCTIASAALKQRRRRYNDLGVGQMMSLYVPHRGCLAAAIWRNPSKCS
jgi:hypothetical protein